MKLSRKPFGMRRELQGEHCSDRGTIGTVDPITGIVQAGHITINWTKPASTALNRPAG
jgi:hypothetical protein